MAQIIPLEVEPPVPRPRRPSSATRPPALPGETPAAAPSAGLPKWSQIAASPKYQAMNAADQESVRASFWRDVVLPMVPANEFAEARKAFDERTKPAKTAPAQVPTWSQIESAPKYQALDDAGKESVRMSFWRDVVSPRVPTPELEQARAEFDERTQPTGDPELEQFYRETQLADRVFNPLVAGGKQVRQGVAAASAALAARNLREFDAMRHGEGEGAIPRRVRSLAEAEFQAARKTRIDALDREVSRVIGYQQAIEKIPTNPALTATGQAKTMGEALEQFWRDPLGVTMAISLQSLPYSAPGLVMGTAGAALAGPAAGAVLLGLGSFGAEYLNSVLEGLGERGVDTKNVDALKAAFQDEALMSEARQEAATRGGIIGSFDALTFGIASKTLAPKALAGKALTPAARQVANLPTQMAVQAAGDAGGEAGAQLATKGEIARPGEVLLEAAGEFGTAPIEVAGLASAARARRPAAPSDEMIAELLSGRAGILEDPAALFGMIVGEEARAQELGASLAMDRVDVAEGDAAAPSASPAAGGPRAAAVETQAAVPQREADAAIEPAIPPATRAREITATEQEPGAALESPVDEEAHEAATSPTNELPEPTQPQKVAGNYQKGHARISGLDISIENPEGSERSGVDPSGKPWTVTTKSHYGYIVATSEGKAPRGRDKEHLDVFVKPGTPEDLGDDAKVYVIDQKKPGSARFDEHKTMIGYASEEEARRAYLANYTKGWQGIQAVTRMPLAEFKQWLREGDTTQPARAYRPQLEARHAGDKAADAISGHLLAGRGFASIAEARAFATARMPAGASINVDQALELGAARAAESLERRMRERGATKSEIDLARRGLYTRLPEPIEGETERPAVGIVMTPPYSGTADAEVADMRGARPDAIRQAIRDLFRVPINEGGFKGSRDKLGLYKVKPQTIRVRNQNDIGVIAHETGHHFSETSRKVRELMKAHEAEIRRITPYAASQRTASLQREEGFAEYLRLRWTQPAHAKAAAPGFSAAFEKYVDQGGYRPAFEAIEGAIRDWQNLPPAERILAKVGEPGKPLSKRVNLDRIVFEVLDRFLPLKKMREDLKPGVAPSADPFKLAHLLAGDAAMIEDWLLREAIPFSFARRADPADRGKPLSDILKMIPQDQQREFGAYLIAKRASELMKRGKEHLYSADEIAAGLRLETPQFKAAARELYAYQDRLLDYAVEGGLLSSFVADKFRQFPFYVPFFRVGEPIARHGDIFKEIRGGTENLRDPIANIIESTVRVVHATNRNYVLAKAHDLARSVPGGGRWIEGVPMPERAVRIETEKIIEALREQGVEIDLETAETLATSQTFFLKNPFGDERNRILIVRRSGRAYALQINDELLWEALEGFEPVDIGLVEKILSVPADVLRAGIVLSPEFMARNVARDTLTGFIQSKKGILPVVGTIGGFKEIMTRSDAARLYRAFGGAYGDMWRADRGLERKLVERMARRGGFDPRTIVTPRGLLSLLHRFGSFTEAGTRVAEFKESMGKGTVDELIDAAYNAREVSVDFGMHGHSRSVRFLTRITPFLNPAMQGLYKAVRTGGSAPFTTLLRGAMLTAASIALFLANRGEDWYDELEQWERNVYWHIDIGLRDERGKVIPLRIPKPWEWGAAFGSLPEALVEVAIEQHGKPFLKRLESIVDDVFSLRVIPTALLVPAELWANKSLFFERPIVPESKQRLPAELQATSGTSLAARKAGELTAMPPAKIDYAVRGLFGTLGTYSMMLADQAIALVDDEAPETPPLRWQRSPLVRVFFGDPDSAGSRSVTQLYELLTEAREAEAALRLVAQEEVEGFVTKHKTQLSNYPVLTGAAQLFGALRLENERILRSRDYTAEEKSRLVRENNERIKATAKTIVQRISQPTGGATP